MTPDVRVSEQDAEAVAREAVDDIVADLTNTSDRTRWSVIGKMEHEYRAALDAYREAVERRVRAECAADTKRLDWMQERYVAADFEYTIDEEPATALIIHAPRSARVGPNLRATIDAGLEAQP